MRIDERRLSARVRGRIEQLDAMLMVFDELKLEVDALKHRNRQYLMLLLASLSVGVVGLVFGSMALFQGFSGTLQTALAVGAGIGIFLADFQIAVIERRIHAVYTRKSKQVKQFSKELEASLDTVYGEVKREMDARRGFFSLDTLLER